MIVYFEPSDNIKKKFKVTIVNNNSSKTVHFGGAGYSDYTIHKDYERMKRYEIRHKTRENWNKSGLYTSGFWSKWILWSKPSLSQAIKHTSEKFNIKIFRKSPPKLKHKSPKTIRKYKSP